MLPVGTNACRVTTHRLFNPDTAAWAIVAHGAEGIIWAADPAAIDDELVGISSFDANGAKHHKLARVILFTCEAKKDPGWRNMISRYGTIWWSEKKVRQWHDFDHEDYEDSREP